MSGTFTARDRQVARYTHKLFWRANSVDKLDFGLWLLTRPPALFIYHVIIPFQVAYGLQAIITRHFDKVGHYGWLVLLSGVAYSILWGIGGVVISRNGRASTEYLQKVVFANYLSKDYDFFSNTFLGSLGAQAARLKDALNEYSTLLMNGVVKQFVIIVASMIIIAYQSLLLALITLISMTLVLSFTIASGKWRLKYRRLLSEVNSEIAGAVGDALSHGDTVKSFAAEAYEQEHLLPVLKRQVNAQFWSWMTSIPSDIGRLFLAAAATVALLLLTARLYEHGSISIAIVVLVQLYVVKLVNATQEIADLIKTYEAIMSGAHQAVKTMLIEPKVKDPEHSRTLPKNATHDVDLVNVTYRYPDAPKKVSAVRDFTLSIKQGEKVGLVGYSGSGKTTLTKLLLRFMDVTEGSIQISGIDIRELTQQKLRSNIAYVPQEPLLFHRTIAENISYGKPDADKKAVLAAAKAAYVNEFVKEMSQGYDTLVGEKGVKLSGGQRQRVAIARALLKDAPILVLDEATSALDSRSEQYIQKALWNLMEGRTAIVIAHRLSTIQRMDRIVVMDKGKIVDIGSHEELLNRKEGIYAKLWAHQSGGYIGAPTDSDSSTQ
jgi:ATP-binding cassette, subfamily B, bacterial